MKLSKLHIKNYGCFGNDGVEIVIDNIVVLIGINDSGKSTVLDAYQDFASMGKELAPEKFNSKRNGQPVVIEATFTDVTEDDSAVLGAAWIHQIDDSDSIRVRWEWVNPSSKGVKQSFDPENLAWVNGGMGGWDTLIQSRIPVPLRIGPDSDPLELEAAIRDILISTVKTRLKQDGSDAQALLDEIQSLSSSFRDHVVDDINQACVEVTQRISQVFPGYTIGFEPSGGKFEPEKIIGAGSYVTVGSPDNEITKILNRGTGIQRSFLWSALSALADLGHIKKGKKKLPLNSPRMLLVDEPESFLHPPAIRRARDCLYGIAEVEDWQVICTTHSPVFIDVSKPHTSIVRVTKSDQDHLRIFQTDKADFSIAEKESLRMVRVCDPTVCEFFFADRVFIVEGETEQIVYTNILRRHADDCADSISVINARGKANIVLFMKILNQFGVEYTAIHDSDSPRAKRRDGTYIRNGMWTENQKIFNELSNRGDEQSQSFVVAQIPDFEQLVFNQKVSEDKPYFAIQQLSREDYYGAAELSFLRELCAHTLAGTHPGQYTSLQEMKLRVITWAEEQAENIDQDLWVIPDD